MVGVGGVRCPFVEDKARPAASIRLPCRRDRVMLVTMPAQLLPVSDDVVCIRRNSYLTCSYVVRTADGVVAIDTGMRSDGTDVWHGLSAIGARPEDLRAVLVTHWHNDHSAGTAAVQTATGTPVYYHEDERPFMTRETARPGLRGWVSDQIPERGLMVLFKGLIGEAPPAAADATTLLRDGDVVAGEFRVLATPGHTPGQVCYLHEPTGTLFVGDTMAVIDQRIRFMARPVTPDIPRARESMAHALSHDVAAICPGHREPLTVEVDRERRRMLAEVTGDRRWPLLG